MDLARKLSTAAAVVLVAMAASVSSASATYDIEVADEGTGLHCTQLSMDFSTGGCPVHLTGGVGIWLVFFGVPAQEAVCDVEMDGRLDEDGRWAIDAVAFVPGDANCVGESAVAEPCDLPWVGSSEEVEGAKANVSTSTISVCLELIEVTGEEDCEGTWQFNMKEIFPERYEMPFNLNPIGVSFCEMVLTGQFESGGSNTLVHINHL